MSTADGRLTITFNGEIYNFKELRHDARAARRGRPHRRPTPRSSCARTKRSARRASITCGACSPSPSGTSAIARACWPAIASASSRSITTSATAAWCLRRRSGRSLAIRRGAARSRRRRRCTDTSAPARCRSPGTLLKRVRCLEAGTRDDLARRAGARARSTGTCRSRRAAPAPSGRRATQDGAGRFDPPPFRQRRAGRHLPQRRHRLDLHWSRWRRQAGIGDLRTFTMSSRIAGDEGDRARRTAEHFGTRHAECRVDARGGQRAVSPAFCRRWISPASTASTRLRCRACSSERGMKVMLSRPGRRRAVRRLPVVPRRAATRAMERAARQPRGRCARAVASVLERQPRSAASPLADMLEQPPEPGRRPMPRTAASSRAPRRGRWPSGMPAAACRTTMTVAGRSARRSDRRRRRQPARAVTLRAGTSCCATATS